MGGVGLECAEYGCLGAQASLGGDGHQEVGNRFVVYALGVDVGDDRSTRAGGCVFGFGGSNLERDREIAR